MSFLRKQESILIITVFSDWIPAFAGMTGKGAGMTRKGAGTTRKREGMTGKSAVTTRNGETRKGDMRHIEKPAGFLYNRPKQSFIPVGRFILKKGFVGVEKKC